MNENPAEIERAVMAEIKQALCSEERYEIHMPPPTISIPGSLGPIPSSSVSTRSTPIKTTDSSVGQTASMATDSFDGEDHTVRSNVAKVEEAVSTRKDFDASGYQNDSFMVKLSNLSVGSSSGIDEFVDSLGDSEHDDTQKFYIDTVDEVDEDSFASQVSQLEAEDLSRRELMDVIQRLYQNLKQSDFALATERSRRKSREGSLIKLAKELAGRDARNEEVGLVIRVVSFGFSSILTFCNFSNLILHSR